MTDQVQSARRSEPAAPGQAENVDFAGALALDVGRYLNHVGRRC